MTADELVKWLAQPEPSQRAKLQTLRDAHLSAIRGLPDADYQTVIRAIKKRLGSPKIADEVAKLLHDLSHDRVLQPLPAAEPDPEPVLFVGTSDDPQLTAIEAAIAAEPEAQGAYTVLGDYYASLGDVRGDFIMIGHALAKNPNHKSMRAKFDELVALHGRTLWGEFADDMKKIVRNVDWHMGFIRGCKIEGAPNEPSLANVIELLFDGPGRFLQHLFVSTNWEATYEPIARALATKPRPTLRTLDLIDDWIQVGDISAMWPALAYLRGIKICGKRPMLGNVIAPRLEKFALDYGPNEDNAHTVDRLASVLAGEGLPALRKLVVTNCECADELVSALVRSPLLPRLTDIDLRMGTLSDVGGRTLLEHRDAIKHARWNLEENYLSDPVATELADIGSVAYQRSGDRYAAGYGE